MTKTKRLLIFLGVITGLARASASDGFHAGPLFDEFSLTMSPGQRTEMLGPLFYSEEKETEKTWAIPSVISHVEDPATDSEEYDFVYPVLTYDRYGSEYRWQFFQLLSFAGGRNPDQMDQQTTRFTLFPFYFQQRSPDTNLNYTALVPFYGHLKHRLSQDEMFFVMLPFYMRTRKADVVTENYLFPFFHVRHGEKLDGWQFWPLYGQEHKGVTYRTNDWGDVETIGGHENRFVLWPFFLSQQSGIGTDNPDKQQALLPVYSYERSPKRDSTTVFWPFFTHVTDREKKYTEWETPWPLIVFARGEGKTTSRVWPLFSQAQTTNLESRFYLWPFYKYNRVHADPLDRERTRILFFLYSDTIQKNTETGNARRRVDFWPLFTHKRDYDGSTRLQVLSILEPLLPNSKSIERDYSQLWSFWRSERNAKTGAASQSLLWNLYRRDVAPGKRNCSLLFGLFQYQSGSEGKRLRLFYIPVKR